MLLSGWLPHHLRMQTSIPTLENIDIGPKAEAKAKAKAEAKATFTTHHSLIPAADGWRAANSGQIFCDFFL